MTRKHGWVLLVGVLMAAPSGAGADWRPWKRAQCCPPVPVETKEPAPAAPAEPAPKAEPAPPEPTVELPAELAVASLGAGANTPILGRADSVNRFNLFDNMTAMPRSRMWMGMQTIKNFTPSVILNPAAVAVASLDPEDINILTFKDDEVLFRFGTEVAVTEKLSIALQAQYAEAIHSEGFGDRWVNPQLMFKRLIHRNDFDGLAVAATFGIQPEFTVGRAIVNEGTSKFYPGLLAYRALPYDSYVQSGFQFGLPEDSNAAVTTFDWLVSLGHWIYGDGVSIEQGGGGGMFRGLVRGITTQVEFIGKHVISEGLVPAPYGLRSTGLNAAGGIVPLFASNEPEDVVDLTFGLSTFLGRRLSVGTAFSVPLSSRTNRVRDGEMFFTVNYALGGPRS